MKVIKVKKIDADAIMANVNKLKKCNKLGLEMVRLLQTIKEKDIGDIVSQEDFGKKRSKLETELMFLEGNADIISDFVKRLKEEIEKRTSK